MAQVTESFDIEGFIFGSGFDKYPWWLSVTKDWEYDSDVRAPHGWVWHIKAGELEGVDRVAVDVDRDILMRAVDTIVTNGADVGASAACVAECKNVGANWRIVDFDCCTADEVMQVAVFGGVFYG